mgnify:FL=1
MKLVEKLIVLQKNVKDNNTLGLFDIRNLLKERYDLFNAQKRLWRNSEDYDKLLKILQDLENLNNEYDKTLEKINNDSNDIIRKEEIGLLQRDYTYFKENEKTSINTLTKRIEHYPKEFIDGIIGDIGYHSDWRWAGVELNPNIGKFTRSLLNCDPLYVYLGHVNDKQKIKEKFNDFYAERRLCFYDTYDKLPQESIGIATSIANYEYWPTDPIIAEVKQVYKLLCPGGIFIFTFNDCEHSASLDFCGSQFRCYNTKTLIQSIIEGCGFDLIESKNIRNGSHSWMIVKKPGERLSRKLSAPLVAIKRTDKDI